MTIRRVVAVVLAGSGLAVAGSVKTSSEATTEPPPTSAVVAPADQPGKPLELGLAPLALLAPATTGAGERPAFSWEAVDDAASYALAVITSADEPLWAWEGSTTEVILGGWSESPTAEAFGPLLLGEARWFVVAFDAAGVPIANSVMRPVAP